MENEKDIDPVKEVKWQIAVQSVTGSEKEFARYLADRFASMGCTTSLYEAAPGRFNITAVIEGESGEGMGLLFHGHLDTVPAYNMKNPFTPEVREGHVYGRGSVDQKGGIAAVVSAFERYLASGRKNRKSIGFVGVIDEESEHRGSMALKAMGIMAEFAVVTEPTALKIGIGCKGTAPVKVDIKGKAAHGCRPWLGKNAVLAAMDIAAGIMNEPLPECFIEGIGKVKASWNLGKIEGGKAYNIVPDRCSIWFDRRLIPGETQKQVLEKVRTAISRYSGENGITGCANIARPDWNWDPIRKRGLLPVLTEINSRLVAFAKEAHYAVEQSEPVVFFTDGYQEMDFLVNDLGIESIQYGPGDSSLCHTDNEQLSISELKRCSRVYSELIRLICE